MPGADELAALSTDLPTVLDVGHSAQVFYDTDVVREKLQELGEETVYGQAQATTARGFSKMIRLDEDDC